MYVSAAPRRRVARAALGDVVGGFRPTTEAWRDRVTAGADDLPVEFLMAWIDRESGGDPCSYTSLRESGIFQLEPPENTAQGGTTEAALRSMCSGGSHSQFRQMTEAEMNEQVRSGVQYIQKKRDETRVKLAQAGVNWSEDSADFWRVVKLQHAYPAPTVTWLNNATAALGRPPATWAEMRAANPGARADVLNNAEWVGGYGEGGGGVGSSVKFLILLGGLGALAAIMYRYSRH